VLDPRTFTKDIWIMDVARSILTQLTFDPGNETFPIWSPDDRWVMFASDREGGWQLYKRRADGVGGDERVATTAESIVPQHWAPDGESVVYLQRPANLGVLRFAEPRSTGLIDGSRFEGFGRLDGYGQVSPDGRWLAYGSNESGQWETYIQRYPTRAGGKWKISDGPSSISTRWSPEGHEVFYYSSKDSQIVAVPIATDPALKIGTPVPLFKANLLGGPFTAIIWRMQYAIATDGRRLLLNEPLEDAYAHAPITVVSNWMSTLRH
jgi:eukaryotic-like serine/threonine-protein kinase